MRLAGHFLDVDLKRDKINTNSKASLISPKYEAHDKERCMDFWYILRGTDYGKLSFAGGKNYFKIAKILLTVLIA